MENITRQLQLAELEIAKTIIDICNRHNLRWYGWFGTAIGAVRHNGFIPWDEDLDLALPRSDYQKLLKYMETELKRPLEVLKYAGKYRLDHIVVHNTATTFIDKNRLQWPDWYRGVFVDIFPIDGMPNNLYLRRTYHAILDFTNKVRDYHRYDASGCPTWKSRLVYYLLSDKIANVINDLFSTRHSFDGSDFYAFTTAPNSALYDHKKETINSFIEMPFEDIKMRLPVGYHEILSQEYGDYMTPPQEDRRDVASQGGIVDLNTSYIKYYNDRMSKPSKGVQHERD